MDGLWHNAFGVDKLTFGNVLAGIELFKCPPKICTASIELGGEVKVQRNISVVLCFAAAA
jgi:hypothetical protein